MSDQDFGKNNPSQQNVSSDEEGSTLKELLEAVLQLVVLVVVFFLIRQFIFVPVSVDGPSMEPTLQHEDRLILNKVSDPERFDVIVFPAPDDSGKQYIKRIIGVPGDSIAYQEGVLYLNGEAIREPYVERLKEIYPDWENYLQDFTLEEITGEQTVSEGHYFVLGDNRLNSKDSRVFGFIEADEVVGTTNFRVWPLNKFGDINTMGENQEAAHMELNVSLIF